MTITLPIQKPGAAETLLSTSSAPAGRRVIRIRASFITPPVSRTLAVMISTARGSGPMATPKALATQSAVMSSWVGPMPPVVNT